MESEEIEKIPILLTLIPLSLWLHLQLQFFGFH